MHASRRRKKKAVEPFSYCWDWDFRASLMSSGAIRNCMKRYSAKEFVVSQWYIHTLLKFSDGFGRSAYSQNLWWTQAKAIQGYKRRHGWYLNPEMKKWENFIMFALGMGKLNFSCKDPTAFSELKLKPWNTTHLQTSKPSSDQKLYVIS